MVQHHKGSLFLNFVSKVALAALVYHVWGERNKRIFQHCNLDVQTMEVRVVTGIRACISAWRKLKNTGINRAICAMWHLPSCIFDGLVVFSADIIMKMYS